MLTFERSRRMRIGRNDDIDVEFAGGAMKAFGWTEIGHDDRLPRAGQTPLHLPREFCNKIATN